LIPLPTFFHLPGATRPQESLLDLGRELGDVNLVAWALGLFDEEGRLGYTPVSFGFLSGEEFSLNT